MARTVLYWPLWQDDFIYFNLDQLATLGGGAVWPESSGPFAIDTTAQIPYGSGHRTQVADAQRMIDTGLYFLAEDERSHGDAPSFGKMSS